MQRHGRVRLGLLQGLELLNRRGAYLPQVTCLRHQKYAASADAGAEASAASSSGVGPTHLHSVVSARDGDNAFAAATVLFGPQAGTMLGIPAGDPVVPAAQRAAKVALLALRGALGCQRPPSALLAFASMDLPRSALAGLAAALAAELRLDGGGGVPLIGCSSRLRLPDERQPASAAAAPSGAEAAAAAAALPYHVTLAAAHLPHHEVHAVHCETGSLPRLPHLADAIRGRRPPAFLLLAGADSLGAELVNRLENLFPGSCVGAGVAAQQSTRDRRLMLVGPGGRGGGGGGGGDAVTLRRADGAVGPSGRGTDDPFLAAAVTAATAAGPGRGGGGSASEMEGPFQRMLLDRDGTSGSSSSGSGGAGSDVSCSSGSAAAGGRRRRLPPAVASGPGAASSTGIISGEEAAVATQAVSLEDVSPPFVVFGDLVHGSGGALLALYPKAAAAAAAATAAASSPTHGTASGGNDRGASASPAAVRLSAESCDLLARVALGTEHLDHVALRGAALAAISPAPTGPEPASPQPAAPENPYYWWPAAVAHPAMSVAVDPNDPNDSGVSDLSKPGVGTGADAGADAHAAPATRSLQNGETTPVAAAVAADGGSAAAKLAAASEAVREAVAALVGGGGGGAGEDAAPSAAALSAMTDGLRGLPLFPLESAILFPGQTMQLRVFEKRYRALMRAVLEQGATFGLCWRGMGTTAVVRSYQSQPGGSGDMMVLLEGGVRFSYDAEDLTVLPATYGINAAKRAEYVLDELPSGQEDVEAMLAAARSVIDRIASHMEAATSPTARQSARTFANALHFASSQQQPVIAQGAAASGAAGTGGDGGGGSDAALLAADIAEAKAALEPETASLLSLYLAPHIPVHLDSLRRGWLTSRSALWRLQQEAAWLRGSSRVCLAAASSVLRLPREHPLRVMLGLSRVAAVL